jgi:PleD family two-component response regulator
LLSALLRLADRQLYLAKAQGRDRAVGPAYVAYPMLATT